MEESIKLEHQISIPHRFQRRISIFRQMAELQEESRSSTNNNKALYNAAKTGDVEALKAALKNGACPNYTSSKDEGDPTSLHETVKLGDAKGIECTKMLLDKGANIDATLLTNRNTPLIVASGVGAEEVCKLLIERKNGEGQENTSPDEEYVCQQNTYGNTPLHAAVRAGSVDTVQLLFDHGAKVDAVNHVGSNILHLCSFLCKTTEKAPGGNSSAKDRRASRLAAVEPHVQIAAMAISTGNIDIDATDSNGFSAIHIAAQRGCIELVKLLVDSGASLSLKTAVDHRGRGGRNAAACADFAGMNETKELLIQMKEMKEDDISLIVTKQLAEDLKGGYSVRNPFVGSGGAAVRRRSYHSSDSEKSFTSLVDK